MGTSLELGRDHGICHTEKRTAALAFHGRRRLPHLRPEARTIPGPDRVGTNTEFLYFGLSQVFGTVSCLYRLLPVSMKAERNHSRFSLEAKHNYDFRNHQRSF